jgi:hypothetical protein
LIIRLGRPTSVHSRRVGEGALGVHGGRRRDLEADIAVAAVQAVVGGAEDIGGGLDVFDGDPLIEPLHRLARSRQGLDLVVIGVAFADRLFEDRRI